MTSPRKPGFVLPVAVTLAVVLGLYVGAYYAMVEPNIVTWTFDPYYGERLPVDGARVVRFFTPIHWLDRCIRPHVWEPTE